MLEHGNELLAEGECNHETLALHAIQLKVHSWKRVEDNLDKCSNILQGLLLWKTVNNNLKNSWPNSSQYSPSIPAQ